MPTFLERADLAATAILGTAPSAAQRSAIVNTACHHLRIEPETLTAEQKGQAVITYLLDRVREDHARLNRPAASTAMEQQLKAQAASVLPAG
jgi:hypothetical protein